MQISPFLNTLCPKKDMIEDTTMKKNIVTIETINQIALDTLSKGNFYDAQEFFRKNAKESPCFISLNNLGVYYLTEGMELHNGKVCSADKLGLKYLKLAETYLQSHLNLMAIGNYYFRMKEYKTATEYFRRGCNLCNSYDNYYNLGVALYLQENYEEATINFEKALDLCNTSDEIEICVSYAFSSLHRDKRKAYNILQQILEFQNNDMKMDEFVLAYLCGDMQLARNLIKPMFDIYSVGISEMAMVFDCLFQLGKEAEAEEYLKYQIEILQGYSYNIKPKISSTKQIFDNFAYREKAISDFRYTPPLIAQCYFIGCKKHNGTANCVTTNHFFD
jgi:tetratricopeptide (TPR) repeat protein